MPPSNPPQLGSNLEELRETLKHLNSLQTIYQEVRRVADKLNRKANEDLSDQDELEMIQIELIDANEELKAALQDFQESFPDEASDESSILSPVKFQESLYNLVVRVCSTFFGNPELDEEGVPMGEEYDRATWIAMHQNIKETVAQSLDAIETIKNSLYSPATEETSSSTATLDEETSPESETTFEQLKRFHQLLGQLRGIVYKFALEQGVSPNEIAGRSDAISAEIMREQRKDTSDIKNALEIIDGLIDPSDLSPSIEVDGYDEYISSIVQDIDANPAKAQELVNQIDTLYQQVFQSKEALFAARALFHNLRTAHFTIKSYTQFLLDPQNVESNDYAGKVALFIYEVQRELMALDRFLSYREAPVSEMCNFVTPHLIKKYAYQINLDIDPSCEIYNIQHAQQVERLVEILIENAIQALRDAGIENPTINIKVEEITNEELIVSFADNGPGIPEKIQPYIFAETAKSTKGTSGQGLYFARQALVSIGGFLELVQTGAQGTEFKVTLPLSKQT